MKISIITITFNSEKTLEETIKSVISQNLDKNELEYILIDGGSTDRTLEIVNKYKKYFSVIVSESDKGIPDAINKGIEYATGDIIGILNSDDIYLKNALIEVMQNFDENTDVLYGDIIFYDQSIEYKYEFVAVDEEQLWKLKKKMNKIIFHPASFIRKAAYDNYGNYSLLYRSATDWDLFLRFYLGGAKFKHLSIFITEFRSGGFSDSNDLLGIKEERKILRKYNSNKKEVRFIIFKKKCMYYIKIILKRLQIYNKIKIFSKVSKNKKRKYSDL